MGAPFRTSLIAFAVAALGIAAAYAAARAPLPQPRAATPQYNILFSRNDKLCNTMRDFYNRHIRNFDDQQDGYIEEQFADELGGTGVEFVFENKGWRPDSSGSIIWKQVLRSLDIYNDGNLRNVVLQDRPISNFLSQYTRLYILNPDVPSDKVTDIISDEFMVAPPGVEQIIDFNLRSGSSLIPSAGSVYLVPEVPPSGQRKFGGLIGGQSRKRLLRYQNHIYGIARTALDEPIRLALEGSSTLVFSVSRAGPIKDECYLEFQFPR